MLTLLLESFIDIFFTKLLGARVENIVSSGYYITILNDVEHAQRHIESCSCNLWRAYGTMQSENNQSINMEGEIL